VLVVIKFFDYVPGHVLLLLLLLLLLLPRDSCVIYVTVVIVFTLNNFNLIIFHLSYK